MDDITLSVVDSQLFALIIRLNELQQIAHDKEEYINAKNYLNIQTWIKDIRDIMYD